MVRLVDRYEVEALEAAVFLLLSVEIDLHRVIALAVVAGGRGDKIDPQRSIGFTDRAVHLSEVELDNPGAHGRRQFEVGPRLAEALCEALASDAEEPPCHRHNLF